MDINTTEYLSKLPKEALTTLAKAWKSLQSGILSGIAISSGIVIYIFINKERLIPGMNPSNIQVEPTLAEILPFAGLLVGSIMAFFIITLISTLRVRGKVRKVAEEHSVPFKGLLKESKKKQKLLKPYL